LGLGVDTRIIHSAADYALHQTSGHMWMIMLEGRHVSTDVAIVGGEPRWWRHVTGQSAGEGTFDHWTYSCTCRFRKLHLPRAVMLSFAGPATRIRTRGPKCWHWQVLAGFDP
jgi:hypothetical protein